MAYPLNGSLTEIHECARSQGKHPRIMVGVWALYGKESYEANEDTSELLS